MRCDPPVYRAAGTARVPRRQPRRRRRSRCGRTSSTTASIHQSVVIVSVQTLNVPHVHARRARGGRRPRLPRRRHHARHRPLRLPGRPRRPRATLRRAAQAARARRRPRSRLVLPLEHHDRPVRASPGNGAVGGRSCSSRIARNAANPVAYFNIPDERADRDGPAHRALAVSAACCASRASPSTSPPLRESRDLRLLIARRASSRARHAGRAGRAPLPALRPHALGGPGRAARRRRARSRSSSMSLLGGAIADRHRPAPAAAASPRSRSSPAPRRSRRSAFAGDPPVLADLRLGGAARRLGRARQRRPLGDRPASPARSGCARALSLNFGLTR